MVSKNTTMVAAALVWAAAVVFSGGAASGSAGVPPSYRHTDPPDYATPAQKTTNDGVYTKAQADGAKAQYDKICADCHPFAVAAKKRTRDVPLGEEPFFENWEGRSLDALLTTIVMTMPNDGSAVVSDTEAADLVAYVLQQNGFPAGAAPLTKEGGSAVVARPKK